MYLAHAPAGQHHLVAGLEGIRIRMLDSARKVDPRYVRKITDETADITFDDNTVLLVQGRILDRDSNLAIGQVRIRKRPQFSRKIVPGLVEDERGKCLSHDDTAVNENGPPCPMSTRAARVG